MLQLPGLPEQASAHAAEIDHVLSLEHLMMLALSLFWGGYFIYVLFQAPEYSQKKLPEGEEGSPAAGPRDTRGTAACLARICWTSSAAP